MLTAFFGFVFLFISLAAMFSLFRTSFLFFIKWRIVVISGLEMLSSHFSALKSYVQFVLHFDGRYDLMYLVDILGDAGVGICEIISLNYQLSLFVFSPQLQLIFGTDFFSNFRDIICVLLVNAFFSFVFLYISLTAMFSLFRKSFFFL